MTIAAVKTINAKRETFQIPHKEKKIEQIREWLIEGNTSQQTMAKRLDISQATVCRLVKALDEKTVKQDKRPIRAKRSIRIGQFDKLKALALNAWIQSCNDEIEITTHTKDCPICRGTGKIQTGTEPETDCIDCKGIGLIAEIKKRVRNKTGDSSYMKIAVDCVREMGRLEGSYADKSKSNITAARLIKESKMVDGEVRESIEALYVNAPVDVLLKAKQAIAELKDKAIVSDVSKVSQ